MANQGFAPHTPSSLGRAPRWLCLCLPVVYKANRTLTNEPLTPPADWWLCTTIGWDLRQLISGPLSLH